MQKNKPVITILYGIAGVGKSSIAIDYASEKEIKTVISTDYLREVQRLYYTKEENPFLFTVSHEACSLLGGTNKPLVIKGFQKHIKAVYPAIYSVIKKLSLDGYNTIIEGVHFDSGILNKLSDLAVEINPLLLTIKDSSDLKSRIDSKLSNRKGGKKKMWGDNIDRIMAIQKYLVKDAKTHGINTLVNTSIDGTISKLKKLYE